MEIYKAIYSGALHIGRATQFKEKSLVDIAKNITILAIAILTSPIWGLVLAGAYLYDSKGVSKQIRTGWKGPCQMQPKPLPEKEKSHFTEEDILRIGRTRIGYRHVSTEEEGQLNATEGIYNGCSLNISFCAAESSSAPASFEDLDLRIQKGEDCTSLIKEYDEAITKFICNSIAMDIGPYWGMKTGKDLVSSLDRTRFMIVRTGWYKAADTSSYDGLGRFPKERITPDGVILLRRIQKENLPAIESNKPLTFDLIKCVASHYRADLLRYLREEFDPSQFNPSYNLLRRVA